MEEGKSMGDVHYYPCHDRDDDRDSTDLCREHRDGLRDLSKAVQTRHCVGARYNAVHHNLRTRFRACPTGLHHRVYDGGILQRCVERKSY